MKSDSSYIHIIYRYFIILYHLQRFFDDNCYTSQSVPIKINIELIEEHFCI